MRLNQLAVANLLTGIPELFSYGSNNYGPDFGRRYSIDEACLFFAALRVLVSYNSGI